MKKYISDIEEKRNLKNISQQDLCCLADISIDPDDVLTDQYTKFLNGEGITFENLNKLREALGMISVDDEILMQTKSFK